MFSISGTDKANHSGFWENHGAGWCARNSNGPLLRLSAKKKKHPQNINVNNQNDGRLILNGVRADRSGTGEAALPRGGRGWWGGSEGKRRNFAQLNLGYTNEELRSVGDD